MIRPHNPSQRLEHLARTPTGIWIGLAHIRRPPRQSTDADAIQRALLTRPPWRLKDGAVAVLSVFACAALVLLIKLA